MTVAIKVEGWKRVGPSDRYSHPNNRKLRLREGGRRLTTKPQTQQGKKRWIA